jgi:hypothetical protein
MTSGVIEVEGNVSKETELQKWWNERARLLDEWTDLALKVDVAREAYQKHMDARPKGES